MHFCDLNIHTQVVNCYTLSLTTDKILWSEVPEVKMFSTSVSRVCPFGGSTPYG